MSHPLTTLVLTPWLGGDYFGQILGGLARELVAADRRLVIVETLQEAAPRDEAGERRDFTAQVAWSQADGVVSITTAVGPAYLKHLREAGKPVVLVSSPEMKDIDAQIVRPDNLQGTIIAVEHLVGHGHTRIGFVGNLAQRDIRERFDAYQQALETHGLTADPALVFAAPEFDGGGGAVAARAESGGVLAARALLAAPHRPTALMVGADRDAIGLMRTLTSAGLVIPRDLAIVAFDNIAAGAFTTPPLSSINQPFDDLGSLAGRLILSKMRGDAVPGTTFTPESAVLKVRESCGCAVDAQHNERDEGGWSPGASTELLREEFQEVLQRALHTGDEVADRRMRGAVATTVADAVRLLELGEEVTTAQIEALARSLQGLTSRPDTLHRFTDAMTKYAKRAGFSTAPTMDGASPVSVRVAAAMWTLQAGALLKDAEITDTAIAEQYVVDAGLLDLGGSDPRDLGWLTDTHVTLGALALWEGVPSSGRLKIVGTYDATGAPSDLVGTAMRSEDFPPEGFIARAAAADREVSVVIPVSARERDWGVLAVVAAIDPATARETYQHWVALLCAALESQRLQEELRRSALFDALTGLPNRQLFIQQLENALARNKRSGTPYSVLFLDIDGFKLINDSLGHQVGDRVLQTVGSKIKGEMRDADVAARFGGDEFVILLTDTEPRMAMVAAHRVQATLSQPHSLDGHEIVTRVSIGIASSDIEYASAEDVVRDADTAMYRAKTTEPGTVAYFDATMHESALRRAEMAREVLRGLMEDQFEVHYQPIVDLTSGRTDRFEALVRWRHPERGMLQPADFLAAIEETALIVQLGHWVVNEVCSKLAEWGPRVVNVSVNVSDKEFWSQDLLTHVLTTLKRHDLTPDRLTLEITETILMRRPELSLRLMHRLHEAGLLLHIDDFGTGYSSLETLHRFPVDAIKIDRSFIQTLTTAENSGELISSLVKLGNALGLSVLAEGVETGEQLAFLQDLGCATGQGYLFMPAVTGDLVADLLDRSLHADSPDAAE